MQVVPVAGMQVVPVAGMQVVPVVGMQVVPVVGMQVVQVVRVAEHIVGKMSDRLQLSGLAIQLEVNHILVHH